MTETTRQTAAKCVARIFQGWGHEIRKDQTSGAAYSVEGYNKLTEYEKLVLKEAFDYMLELIEGREDKNIRKDVQNESIRGYRND